MFVIIRIWSERAMFESTGSQCLIQDKISTSPPCVVAPHGRRAGVARLSRSAVVELGDIIS